MEFPEKLGELRIGFRVPPVFSDPPVHRDGVPPELEHERRHATRLEAIHVHADISEYSSGKKCHEGVLR
jgi:hypothetical protein